MKRVGWRKAGNDLRRPRHPVNSVLEKRRDLTVVLRRRQYKSVGLLDARVERQDISHDRRIVFQVLVEEWQRDIAMLHNVDLTIGVA